MGPGSVGIVLVLLVLALDGDALPLRALASGEVAKGWLGMRGWYMDCGWDCGCGCGWGVG